MILKIHSGVNIKKVYKLVVVQKVLQNHLLIKLCTIFLKSNEMKLTALWRHVTALPVRFRSEFPDGNQFFFYSYKYFYKLFNYLPRFYKVRIADFFVSLLVSSWNVSIFVRLKDWLARRHSAIKFFMSINSRGME